ncbi:MAG TPA: hypothetical protein VFC35_04665, partial [Gemmatimonadaceae bacterium]|nr:hypothetical protein [Gemmatimonadaceae bacterium]
MKLNISFVVGCAGILALSACNNTDTFVGPGYICDITNPVQTLSLDPGTSVLLVHSPARPTDVAQLTARATNRDGVTRTD